MTLKQGEEINKKFSSLSDSIKILKESVLEKTTRVSLLDYQKSKLDSLILVKDKSILVSEEEIVRLRKSLEQSKKFHDQERKQWGIWMFISFVITVIGFTK